jgi:virginiamycin B lyase
MTCRTFVAVLALLVASGALAGGSHCGIAPGANPAFAGKVREWRVPTPEFARDPAPGPDGNIYVAVMHGNRIARFDTWTETFKEWELPQGARPHGLLVDRQGIVWYTGNGNGTIGRLDPASGKVTEYPTPSGGGGPHTLVKADDGVIWFTLQSGDKVGRLGPASGRMTQYPTSGGPYGITLDRAGNVWFCRMGATCSGGCIPRPASSRMCPCRPARVRAAWPPAPTARSGSPSMAATVWSNWIRRRRRS